MYLEVLRGVARMLFSTLSYLCSNSVIYISKGVIVSGGNKGPAVKFDGNEVLQFWLKSEEWIIDKYFRDCSFRIYTYFEADYLI